MRPECQESREPWHCTMMYDEEGQNEEYEAMWDEHVARTQYSLKTIDFIVGPQGAAAAAVQLPKQLEQWYQIPDAAPHVSLLIGQGFESKELGPMVKEASKVKQWTQGLGLEQGLATLVSSGSMVSNWIWDAVTLPLAFTLGGCHVGSARALGLQQGLGGHHVGFSME
ncbi:hypothetical protein QTP70_006517 [Hemibagrus guttatus]|uniref:Uncharacterized protein n=1 Tax=Hemibagrus guttatus TaxID=175788 RepID=A0AAE0V1G4_9TELE|nr:hypothetical protein QTP70_006517 [Hemibagrus guttatus]